MLEFQGRKKWRIGRRIYLSGALVFFFLLALFLIKPTWNINRKYLSSSEEIKKAEQQILELRRREEELKLELKQLEDEKGKEAEVLKKFDLVRAGEGLAVIIDPEKEELEEEPPKGFFQKILEWFRKD